MSEAHEEQHERLEREAADMQRHSDQLKEDIADVREDWRRKASDDAVPGARGDDSPAGADQDAREPWPDE